MKQLNPRVVWLFFISSLVALFFLSIFLVPFLIAITAAGSEKTGNFMLWYLAVLAFLIVLNFIWSKLMYRYYKYELAEEAFRKELGVIYKQYVSIPYDRIQNVDIHRGLLERILGLSHLNIQTAGTGMAGKFGAEGTLPGLDKNVAEQVRDELIERARKSKNQGL